MAMTWGGRRQSLYTGFAFIIAVAALFLVWQFFFTSPVSCQNGKKDGTELGVDCGGGCSLICAQQTHLPIVLWQRSFETSPGLYTAAAYIQNNNVGAGAKNVPYAFQLYEGQELVAESDGTMDMPPMLNVPVVVSGISVGNRQVTHTEFCFFYSPHCSPTPADPPRFYKVDRSALPQLSVSSGQASDNYARLMATLSNAGLKPVNNAVVVATLFDADGVARAASKSVVPHIDPKSSQQIVFTWPSGFENIVRSDIVVVPSF